MNNQNTISIVLMLQMILILLKLTNVMPMCSWAWLSITSITWVPFSIGIIILIVRKVLNKKL